MSESITMSVEAFMELVRVQDRAQMWLNLPQHDGIYGRSIEVRGDNYQVDTREDPVLTVLRHENGVEVSRASVRVSEIFDLVSQIRAIVASRADEVHKVMV